MNHRTLSWHAMAGNPAARKQLPITCSDKTEDCHDTEFDAAQ